MKSIIIPFNRNNCSIIKTHSVLHQNMKTTTYFPYATYLGESVALLTSILLDKSILSFSNIYNLYKIDLSELVSNICETLVYVKSRCSNYYLVIKF